jgi:hypothetical protein
LRFSPSDPVVPEGSELVIDVETVGCTSPGNTATWDVYAEGGPAPAAEPGLDFGVVAPPEVTLGQGAPRQTLRLPIAQDDETDPDEAVILTLRARGDATLRCAEGDLLPGEGGIATVVILVEDDEAPPEALPEVSVGPAHVAEGDSGVTRMEFPVRVAPPSRRAVTVHARTEDGSATAEQDYRPYSGLVRFPPGTEEVLVRVPVLGDATVETNETFSLELSDPVNAVLGADVAEGVIEDDDGASDLALEVLGSNARQAHPGEVVVLQVRVSTDSGSVAPGVDVAWSLSTDTDGALLDGATTTTNASGITTQRVHAGNNPGVSSIVASDVGGAQRVTFTVTVGERLGR